METVKKGKDVQYLKRYFWKMQVFMDLYYNELRGYCAFSTILCYLRKINFQVLGECFLVFIKTRRDGRYTSVMQRNLMKFQTKIIAKLLMWNFNRIKVSPTCRQIKTVFQDARWETPNWWETECLV